MSCARPSQLISPSDKLCQVDSTALQSLFKLFTARSTWPVVHITNWIQLGSLYVVTAAHILYGWYFTSQTGKNCRVKAIVHAHSRTYGLVLFRSQSIRGLRKTQRTVSTFFRTELPVCGWGRKKLSVLNRTVELRMEQRHYW